MYKYQNNSLGLFNPDAIFYVK
ncbi:hypothetical protein BN1200_830003 [Klebsiella variicola]|nr:hypothetical protein BN1200_830003 [Klebsiella variicola]